MNRLRGRPFGNRSNPSCKDVAEVLQSYLDGEIDARDLDAVEQHLQKCRDCGLEAETYAAVKNGLARQRMAIAPDVMDRLRDFADNLVSGTEAG